MLLTEEYLKKYSDDEKRLMSKHYKNNQFSQYFETYYSGLIRPISYGETGPGISIWSQIPLTGSLVVGISPFSSDLFESRLGIKIQGIPQMVDFAVKTKKLHFFLTDFPEKYKGLDYLFPIFERLHPPVDFVPFPDWNEYDKFKDLQREFCKNRGITRDKTVHREFFFSREGYKNSDDFIQQIINAEKNARTTLIDLTDPDTRTYYDNISRAYAHLRYFGIIDSYDDLRDVGLKNNYSSDYIEAKISLFNDFLIPKKTRSLNAIHIFDLDRFIKGSSLLGEDQTEKDLNVFELGTHLMKKSAFVPSDQKGCEIVMERYDDAGLPQVYSALNQAVIKKNRSKIIENKENLDEIFNNIWKDPGRIELKAMAINTVPVILGIVGESLQDVSTLSYFILKLLSGTHEIYQYTFPELNQDLMEYFAKSLTDPNLVTIYDFKKKYSFDKCL